MVGRDFYSYIISLGDGANTHLYIFIYKSLCIDIYLYVDLYILIFIYKFLLICIYIFVYI